MATTQEELNKAVLMVRQIDAHLKAFEKEYNDVTNGLQGGIDDESKDEIELWKPKLEPALKDIDKTLDACAQALDSTRIVNKDEAFMKTRFDAVQKLLKHVVTTQKKYADWRLKGRKLGQDADKAMTAIGKSNKEAESEIGTMKNRIANVRKETDKFEDEIKKWRQICVEAAKTHNDKPAEAARLALLGRLKDMEPAMKRTRVDFDQIRKDFPELPPELDTQVAGMGDSLLTAENSYKLGKPAFDEFIEMKKKAMADKAAPPMIPLAELKKEVAKLVGFDPSDTKKLTLLHKLVNSTPHVKWADQLNHHFDLKNGKEIVAKIDKLPYFRKMQQAVH